MACAVAYHRSPRRPQITALVDRHDGTPVAACTLLSGLQNANGVAYDRATGALYVAEVGGAV